jgi:hypothetical protein
VLSHLDEQAPTVIVQELHAKLILVSAQRSEARHGKLQGPVDVGTAP